MKKAVYKTNINCGMCLSKVKPFLDEAKTVEDWSVDLSSKDRFLTVSGENLDQEEVEKLVKEAGYTAEKKKKGLFGR